MGSQVVATWQVDGFLHPPETLSHEFVDVDELVRIPVLDLPDVVQFALVLVDSACVLVFGVSPASFRSVLDDALHDRYPTARRVFLNSARPGSVTVQGATLSDVDACAVAVTQYRHAWDESPEVLVLDDAHRFCVTVNYENEKYLLVSHLG